MRVLALDSAAEICAAAIVDDGVIRVQRTDIVQHGQAARLPALVAELVHRGPVRRIDLIAVTVGPGSFTGLRAALALGHGLGAGWACPVVGVGVVEALAASVGVGTRPVWIALHGRSGHVFLAHDGTVDSHALDDLPATPRDIVLAGNAADTVAARVRDNGGEATVDPARLPGLVDIARIGVMRHLGVLPCLAAQPLYVNAVHAVPRVA